MMNDDKLRAAYQAQVAATPPPNRNACPSPEQLEQLAQGQGQGNGQADGPTVLLDHVFSCSLCRADFQLLRAVHTGASDSEQAEGGSSTRGSSVSRLRFTLFSGSRIAIAAGLLIAAGVGGEAWRRQRDATLGNATMRNTPADASEVTVVSPAESAAIAADARFVWRTVPGAASYELQLLDTTGAVVATQVTSDTTLQFGADDRARMRAAGALDWLVAARRTDGNERRSKVLRVRVLPTDRR